MNEFAPGRPQVSSPAREAGPVEAPPPVTRFVSRPSVQVIGGRLVAAVGSAGPGASRG